MFSWEKTLLNEFVKVFNQKMFIFKSQTHELSFVNQLNRICAAVGVGSHMYSLVTDNGGANFSGQAISILRCLVL